MKTSYEFFEHTADLGIIGHGASLCDALSGVIAGMSAQITDTELLADSEDVEISVENPDLELEDHIVNLLSKTLYLFEVDGMIFKSAKVTEIRDGDMTIGFNAILSGDKYNVKRHQINTHIKAVTYHDMKLRQDDNGWHIRVLFDV